MTINDDRKAKALEIIDKQSKKLEKLISEFYTTNTQPNSIDIIISRLENWHGATIELIANYISEQRAERLKEITFWYSQPPILADVSNQLQKYQDFLNELEQNIKDDPEYFFMAKQSATSQEKSTGNEYSDITIDEKTVFVIHGRNLKIKRAMHQFLRAVGVKPIEWPKAKMSTHEGSPYIGKILETIFPKARAFIVLLTPDDEAKLKREFISSSDEDYEINLTPQARPNVIFEAGLAFGHAPKKVILVEFPGKLRPFSDTVGRHIIKFDGSVKKRQELLDMLHAIGISIDFKGNTDWQTEGDFSI